MLSSCGKTGCSHSCCSICFIAKAVAVLRTTLKPSCVIAARHEVRATVNKIHRLRHQRYAIQRLGTVLGIFGRSPGEDTVALRLDPCPRV